MQKIFGLWQCTVKSGEVVRVKGVGKLHNPDKSSINDNKPSHLYSKREIAAEAMTVAAKLAASEGGLNYAEDP